MYDIQSELKSITRTRKIVNMMVWIITAGAIVFSLMTGAPLVAEHSQWKWTGWVLSGLVDAAFVLSLSADAVLSKHGMGGGKWGKAFRWVTGAASLFLNVTSSVLKGDWIGVAIHTIAPVILICAAEVAPVYRKRFRDLELTLTEQLTEDKVTRVVAKKRVTRTQVDIPQDTIPVGSEETGLTGKQVAIRNGFLGNKSAAEVARDIGVSRSYVSKEFKKIREELALTA